MCHGSCCGDKFGTGCGGCKFIVGIVALLTTITTIATLIGVYNTHMTAEGWMFGTLNGSLAIIALLLSVMCWLKLVKKMCPCGKGSCAGGSCGGGCPGCGNDPCTCK